MTNALVVATPLLQVGVSEETTSMWRHIRIEPGTDTGWRHLREPLSG